MVMLQDSNVLCLILLALDAVLHFILLASVQLVIELLHDICREGFNNVFPLETLKCFYEEELETMLCGTCEHWTVDMLADIIKFEHG